MGRVSRWFYSLLGGRKRWAFVKSFQNPNARNSPPAAAVSGDEQNKHAIAVAVATAAAAEAAMVAAKAAASMLQLTTSGSSRMKLEELAAVTIQAAFRGYLARRALRALKGLVKLQALVRGNIVRKQAAETLRCMKALVRVQAQACACRAFYSKTSSSSKCSHSNPVSYNQLIPNIQLILQVLMLPVSCFVTISMGPATPEKYEAVIRSIASKRNSLKQTGGMNAFDGQRNKSANSNWLYQCREEHHWNMSEASKSTDYEINNEKPRLYSKRNGSLCQLQYSCCSNKSDRSAGSLATEPNSLSRESTTTLLSTQSPSPVDQHQSMSPLLRYPSLESPWYYSAASQPGSSRKGPFTPGKSECSRSFFKGYSNYPNYMANTESSTAKSRSQSVPRQRSECENFNSLRRLSAQGLGNQAAVSAGPRSSKSANVAYSGSRRLDILGMPVRM